MTESKICTCPSGDGSLRHPCPAHPAVEQAGGDERAAFELFVRKHCGMPAHIAVNWDAKFTNDAWEGWKARAALAQPSPAQAEQAEAERPEVVAYFDRNYPSTGDAFIWSNYKGSPYEPVMTVAQHDRIAGALRAENAQLSEDLNRLSIIRSRLNLRLDFALDKISKLESRWPHGESPEERFEHYISNTIDRAPEPLRRLGNWLSHVLDEDQWTTAERMLTGACVAAEERAAAQTQHSVPEGWKPVPIEPLLNMMSDKDHDTRIMAERQLLSILAAAPDKEVGHE
ncbi:TPA: hypothetical protein ACMFQ2_005352 [Pseudomonas aeruginosa]|nr:hypothetical protein [Pseudomonas aeruginosa]EKV3144061.1 hypothetical protein [Pseudomonas aeruginosa]